MPTDNDDDNREWESTEWVWDNNWRTGGKTTTTGQVKKAWSGEMHAGQLPGIPRGELCTNKQPLLSPGKAVRVKWREGEGSCLLVASRHSRPRAGLVSPITMNLKPSFNFYRCCRSDCRILSNSMRLEWNFWKRFSLIYLIFITNPFFKIFLKKE